MRDTTDLPIDNEFKQFSHQTKALEHLTRKLADWSRLAGVTSEIELGGQVWDIGLNLLAAGAGKMASDLFAWLSLPDLP